MKKKELDSIIDQVTAGIRSENADAATVNDAAERVWSQLSSEGVSAPMMSVADHSSDRIEGCADFQALIPAYLDKRLSEARSLLLVDHTHECIPCRKALKEARQPRVAGTMPALRKQNRKPAKYNINPVILRWGIAAMLVIGLGLVAFPLIQRYVPFGSVEATVQAADGPVYAVAENQTRLINAGEKIRRGDTIRTAKDAHAVVRLGDGSTIEMKDRSEFSVDQTLRGTTINLDRGSVIVEAMKQKGKLFVNTGNSLVSVNGTTFAVNAGTKGSRVSVIQGEVSLDHSGDVKTLHAGQQETTNAAIEKISIKEEVAWSRNAARYAQTLDSLMALRNDLNAVEKPGVRFSTRLLDMMPENTVLYAALPNLGATIAESHRIIEERIQQNPALREWFDNHHERRGPEMNQAISVIKDFGEQLGDEIAAGAGMDEQGNPAAPIVLAQLKNPADFPAFFNSEIARISAKDKHAPNVHWIDDPRSVKPDTNVKISGDDLYFWIAGDVLVASPKLDRLQTVANNLQSTSGFTTSQFHDRIAGVYREGAGLVVAADLERIIAQTKGLRKVTLGGGKHEQALNQLGILNLKSFVFDQKDVAGKTASRAVLSFTEAPRGVTSWLAPPAAMGSLDYISPDANLVAGFVVKDAGALVDDLLGVLNTASPEITNHLSQLKSEHGIDLRRDFAEPLGGEYAFAIDGPLVPTPSWKLVFQVNDPARLQQTFQRVVDEANKYAAQKQHKGLTLTSVQEGDQTFYTISSNDLRAVEINYVFSKGYMIAGPSRALIKQALTYRDSGVTLRSSAKFTAGLPADGNPNFSALIYHNLAPLVQPFAGAAKAMPEEQKNAIGAMAANMQPTLAYAYAYGDRIEFNANTEGGPFGLSPTSLLGMPNAFELQHILSHGMNKK